MAIETERRVPLSRDRALQAAISMVDEGGIEALSMRKLGQALGVEAMSLYNHVANKEDILNGIIDLVWSEIELPPGEEGWESAIRRYAISAHDALLRHPWVCNLIMSSTRVRPARLHYMEFLLRRLREAGFSAEATYHAYHALDSHILGFTLWQLGHSVPGDIPRIANKEELARFVAKIFPDLSLEEYPYLFEHGEQHVMGLGHELEGGFEFGLRLILDGLKRIRESEQVQRLVGVRRH
jgi:AcrR family transcriptional regulator